MILPKRIWMDSLKRRFQMGRKMCHIFSKTFPRIGRVRTWPWPTNGVDPMSIAPTWLSSAFDWSMTAALPRFNANAINHGSRPSQAHHFVPSHPIRWAPVQIRTTKFTSTLPLSHYITDTISITKTEHELNEKRGVCSHPPSSILLHFSFGLLKRSTVVWFSQRQLTDNFLRRR